MFKCECGHEVDRHALQVVKIILQPWKIAYVAFKFRCPKCGRTDERVVESTQLSTMLLLTFLRGFLEEEEERFKEMSPITIDEVIEFYRQLKEMKGFPPELLAEPSEES